MESVKTERPNFVTMSDAELFDRHFNAGYTGLEMSGPLLMARAEIKKRVVETSGQSRDEFVQRWNEWWDKVLSDREGN